jgi:hypothetical protein
MNQELSDLKKAHLEKSKKLFTDVAAKVFDKHPILESFSWNQYTPYFNDDEECTFSANTDYCEINGEDWDDYKFSKLNWRDNSPNPDYIPELGSAKEDVKEFLSNIDDSVLRDMFGDHVQVTVKPGGTEVDEYEHD